MPTGTVSKVRQIIKAEEIVEMLQNSILGENQKALNQKTKMWLSKSMKFPKNVRIIFVALTQVSKQI